MKSCFFKFISLTLIILLLSTLQVTGQEQQGLDIKVKDTVSTAWQPPIGIPAPLFGIDETYGMYDDPKNRNLALIYTQNAEGGYYTHYVDNTHPNATDSGNPYGTASMPRKTIPVDANHLPPGSVVEVHGGPYIASSTFNGISGTRAQPIFIRGDSINKPVFTGYFSFDSASYMIIENLNFDGGVGGAVKIIGASYNISVRYNEIQNKLYTGNSAGISITPKLGNTISNVVIYENSIHDLGDWTTTADEDFHGVNPNLWNRNNTTEEYNIWIVDNEFYHISGNGVQVNASNWTDSYKYLHHIYIGKNIGHDNRQAAFASKQASNVIISENIAYGGREHGSQGGDGIAFQYGPDNLWIIFNNLYDNNYGIRQSDTSPFPDHKAYIIGNVIHDSHQDTTVHWNPSGWGISLWGGNMERFVLGNTIYNCHGGIELIKSGGDIRIYNNIIANITDMEHIYTSLAAQWNRVFNDYNLYYQPGGNVRFEWNRTTKNSLAAFQTAYPTQEVHGIEADPLFVDMAGGNVRLQAESAAIDSGTSSGVVQQVFDTFTQLYGIDIRKDIKGNPRIGAWDIGAYEYFFSSAPVIEDPVKPMSPGAQQIPKFWPPPKASATAEIPRHFFSSLPDDMLRLRDANRALKAALESCGYFEKSYYSVPDGFAMVTRLEQINRDGTSKKTPDRWAVEAQPFRKFSFKEYLRALFIANPGYYRIIVFIITPHPFHQEDIKIRPEVAMEWLSIPPGMNRLPHSIGLLEYSEKYTCTALIYEFEQPNPGEPGELKVPSDLQGRTHLVRANLWQALED